MCSPVAAPQTKPGEPLDTNGKTQIGQRRSLVADGQDTAHITPHTAHHTSHRTPHTAHRTPAHRPAYVEGGLVANGRDPHRAWTEHMVPDPFQLGHHVVKVVHRSERLRERDLLEARVPV